MCPTILVSTYWFLYHKSSHFFIHTPASLHPLTDLTISWKPVKVGPKPWRSDIWPACFVPALVPWQVNKSFKQGRWSYQNHFLATGNQKVSQRCYGVSVFFLGGGMNQMLEPGFFLTQLEDSQTLESSRIPRVASYVRAICLCENLHKISPTADVQPGEDIPVFPSWDSTL